MLMPPSKSCPCGHATSLDGHSWKEPACHTSAAYGCVSAGTLLAIQHRTSWIFRSKLLGYKSSGREGWKHDKYFGWTVSYFKDPGKKKELRRGNTKLSRLWVEKAAGILMFLETGPQTGEGQGLPSGGITPASQNSKEPWNQSRALFNHFVYNSKQTRKPQNKLEWFVWNRWKEEWWFLAGWLL